MMSDTLNKTRRMMCASALSGPHLLRGSWRSSQKQNPLVTSHLDSHPNQPPRVPEEEEDENDCSDKKPQTNQLGRLKSFPYFLPSHASVPSLFFFFFSFCLEVRRDLCTLLWVGFIYKFEIGFWFFGGGGGDVGLWRFLSFDDGGVIAVKAHSFVYSTLFGLGFLYSSNSFLPCLLTKTFTFG